MPRAKMAAQPMEAPKQSPHNIRAGYGMLRNAAGGAGARSWVVWQGHPHNTANNSM